ncbi:claspin-like [Odontomachus brunneus]|uniref:claspin-like n=1 Tax=Odontomachus brunneus TaxID=486640 RepID=UPI0013F28ECA|nr:claspin-like [Odontomachus brunneus]
MAVVDHPTTTNVTEVYLSNYKDLNQNEHHIGNDEGSSKDTSSKDILKDTSICNKHIQEIHRQKHDGNIEENSRETVCILFRGENEHYIGNDESSKDISSKDISKDISICNKHIQEIHRQKQDGNIEENSRETVCILFSEENTSSNLENTSSILENTSSNLGNISSNREDIPNNKVSNNLIAENGNLNDKIDSSEVSKIIEMRIDDKYLGDGGVNISEKFPSRKFMTFVDSDSEEDITIYETSNKFFAVDKNKYFEHSQITKYKKNSKIIKSIKELVDSESEDNEETCNIYNSSQTSPKATGVITNDYQILFESESEKEKETKDYSVIFDETDMSKIKNTKEKSVKKIKGSIRAAKNEAMHKIHSESQRLLRETRVSLPYHRPKQRTLQEFLNRKKLSVTLPKTSSTAAKLKMSSTIVSEIVEEKEKEAEHFYKSSDSEDDTHEVTSVTCDNVKKSFTTNEEQSVTDIELICAQDTQNIEINDQNSHGKKEIAQQDNTDFIAHKILIENDSCEADYQSNGHVLGLPLPKFTNDISILDREKLSPKFAPNFKFTLKGSPDMIIDLTDDAKPNSKGVNSLLDRFFCKHVVNTNKQTDNKSEVTIIHLQDTENGPIPVKEVLPGYKLSANTDLELNKPGAKLTRLKEHLKLQMSLKRNEEWKQKETEMQTQEKEMWNEEEEIEYDLNGQKKADIFGSSDSGESEPEENDVYIKDKKRKKCSFADDEAEVTDNENSDADETGTNEAEHGKQSTSLKHRNEKKYMDDNETDIDEVEEEEEEEEEADDEDKYTDKDENKVESKTEFMDKNNDNVGKNINIVRNEKKRKRLIQKYQDDSEDEDSQSKSIVDTHISKSDNNGCISGNEQQPEVATKSHICKTPITRTSMLDFVSPITQLSILNNSFDSNKIEHSIDRYEFMKNTQSNQSPEHARDEIRYISQKKLFYDIEESIDDEYLMQLCSTKFQSTQRSDLDLKSSTSRCNTIESQSHEFDAGSSSAKSTNVKELRNSEMEYQISQEKDLFNSSVCCAKKAEKVSTADSKLKLMIVSSDEEDAFLKPKKRSIKRLNLSDSEEDARSCIEEDDSTNDEETEEKYVDYDSEENEVMVIPKKDIQKVAADFLEKEAELSESDWDSADEDEKDLDKLEFEEADEEHLDEDEVRNQLGKIHMKQVLDEDKKEVRLLKELLFEDGDLHTDGAGRERKFKWRNIDKLGNDIEMPQMLGENDGWVDLQEDEEEAKWNKHKHERDKFLEERMKTLNNEIEDDLCDSQIFKFGLETLKKTKSNESQKQVSSDKADLSENMEPIMPRNITDLLYAPNTGKKSQTIYDVIKRRSLLTRGEESLARIASLAKQNDPASHTVNTRNFVFQYIDPCANNTSKYEETKEAKEERDRHLQNQLRKRKVKLDFNSAMKKRRK